MDKEDTEDTEEEAENRPLAGPFLWDRICWRLYYYWLRFWE